jgi:hypothetical protein
VINFSVGLNGCKLKDTVTQITFKENSIAVDPIKSVFEGDSNAVTLMEDDCWPKY